MDLCWEENQEKHREFADWLLTCCAHPDMEQASERISNWSGYRFFQQQLQTFGAELFPTLEAVLPENNSGKAPADKAAAALAELDTFCRQDFGGTVELVDAEANQSLHEYVEAYDGLFMFSPEGVAGFDPAGYFVRHTVKGMAYRVTSFMNRQQRRNAKVVGAGDRRVKGRMALRRRFFDNALARPIAEWFRSRLKRQEVFRSMAFSQEQIGPTEFKLTDMQSGRSIVTPLGLCRYLPEKSPVTGKQKVTYPKRFVVRRRALSSTDFLYILEPLRKIFQASLETGNPVCWM
ncbi:MAG TPA: hypothetical protein VJA94_21920 [Candidatus Angelobacter sp.]